ncbi:unnamed protein product [Cochlearia groenlandica]
MGRESVSVVLSPTTPTPTTETVEGTSASAAATSLAPGFRFHPTDEELVSYYLKRKVLSKPVRFDAIGEVDIYKHEPWDLAVFSRLKTRDQEWYFFSALDKKYGNGARMNRATNKGYWKATGKDREIRRDIHLLGMKKTLVFHSGRAPDGLRTNWVMHEYRLVEYETEFNGTLLQDAYVLCRVFHKNNIGPPSGNRYAPFMEEEWADDKGAMIPGVVVTARAEPLPLANGNNQEFKSASKDLININEPPRETTPMDIEPNYQNHHESAIKPQDYNNNNNHYEEYEEALKREHADEDEHPPYLCALNKEAPLPLLQYKRRRQNESNNSSSRATQHDHCSSTTTTVDNTITIASRSAAATNTAISALLEFSLMGISDKKEISQQTLRPHKEAPPLPPHDEMVNELQKEVHQMSVERETFKLEMMSAEAMISILQSRIDALRQENNELKKNMTAIVPDSTSLAPGFRFHPTDEELVSYYLKLKVLSKLVRFDAIGEVDIYKHEPWNLAVFSRLKTRDQEWYFYSALDKKYGNGARMNRGTNKGYWKATGKDREIRRDIQLLGMKKTLVFHSGRAPGGIRTNWVMHEYRLVEYEKEKNGNLQDAYVLCRVFHKNNIGPPIGNRYAPFMEEEWADDKGAMIPGVDVTIRAEPLPLANGNNQMDKEFKAESKDLISINEPPRETTPTDIKLNQQYHHANAIKPHENNNNNNHYDEETLKREHAKEDPSPLRQYKRRRVHESKNNSNRTTQHDHCAVATNTAISALLEFSLMSNSEKKPLDKEASPTTTNTTPIQVNNDLVKKIHEMCVERESFKLEMMSAEAMISILQSRIDALRQENYELMNTDKIK